MPIDIEDLKERFQDATAAYNDERGKQKQLKEIAETKAKRYKELREQVETITETKFLLTRTAEAAREKARQHLECIVTEALQYVFGPDFKFVIEMREVRGRAEADFYVESLQGGEIVRTDPMSSRGGGVVDIIAIALQLAILQIHADPKIQGPLILDEPGKHVDQENVVRLAMFIEEMSQQFNRQIILVTHQPHLAEIASNSYNIELKGGRSVASKRLQPIPNRNQPVPGPDEPDEPVGT